MQAERASVVQTDGVDAPSRRRTDQRRPASMLAGEAGWNELPGSSPDAVISRAPGAVSSAPPAARFRPP